jgi:hypothetical protein
MLIFLKSPYDKMTYAHDLCIKMLRTYRFLGIIFKMIFHLGYMYFKLIFSYTIFLFSLK